jgi:hypothetical protein
MAKAPINVSISGDYKDKDIKRAMKDLGSLQKDASGTESGFSKLGKSALGLGAALGLGFAGVQTLANVFKDSIAEAQEAIKVNAATAQIIKATGSAANVTADQVADLSQRISEQIAVDDELIQTSANLILTFKNVRNEGTGLAAVFDRTVLAAQDLSAAGFGDAESAAKMLGKALNDPKLGLTALSRAGVTFTEQQKDQIKTLTEGGDVLKAQQLILAEVESQVGGVAGATATGIDKFNVYFSNLKEELGLAILPLINALISGLIPAIKGLTDGIKNSSTFIQENKTAIILVTVAVAAFTAALVVQRAALTASSIAFAANVVASKLLVGAINLTTTAIVAMSAAMRLIPFVAIATAAVAFVMVLDQGAKSQKAWREETKRSLDATNGWKDAQGNATKAAVAYAAANRFSKYAQQDLTKAISGTVGAAIAAGNAMGSTLTPNTYEAGEAAERAASSYVSLWEAIWNAKRIASDFANTSGTVTSAISEGVKMGGSPVWQKIASGYGAVDKAANGAAGSAGSVNKELDKLSDKKQKRMDALKDLAETAKKSMSDMRDSVYGTVVGWLDLGNAFDTYKARQTAVTETLKALEEQRKTMTAESTQDQKDKLQELADAHERAKDAAASGAQSIVAEFNEQAKKFGEFGAKLQQLLKAGLNKTSFMQILSMGAERGGEVADSYLTGNTSELVRQTNSTMAEYDKLSQSIAEESSRAFYQAGLKSALALLKAFTAALGKGGSARREMKAIIKDLEKELQINVTTNVATPGGGTSSFTPSAPAASQSGFVPFIDQNWGTGDPFAGGIAGLEAYAGLNFGAFANGGLVRGPMLGLVGEAGPELIVPLDKVGRMGGSTIVLNVNAGMGTNGAEVGRQIVDALKAYERRNGAVYASA